MFQCVSICETVHDKCIMTLIVEWKLTHFHLAHDLDFKGHSYRKAGANISKTGIDKHIFIMIYRYELSELSSIWHHDL